MTMIETTRLRIRNFTPADWRELREIAIDKAESEYAAYDFAFPTTEKEVREMTGYFVRSGQFWAVCEKTSRKMIGYIALNGDKPDEKNLGYTFLTAFQGRGFALEACRAMADYAFRVLKLERLTSGTAEVNLPSVKLLAALGFSRTGQKSISFSRDSSGNEIRFNGLEFKLERSEWNGKTGRTNPESSSSDPAPRS